MIVVVTQEQRLDEIVFAHYNSLEYFDEVVRVNENIMNHMVLKVGDKVELPKFKKSLKSTKIKALWD